MSKEIDTKMHTTEHILNQTMVRFYNQGRCFSAHIEKKKSKCDYHFNHALTPEEIKKIEEQVNSIIQSDLPVIEEYILKADADTRFPGNRSEDGQDKVRIIKIGNYDQIPCIGPHVSTTKEIGKFKIISSDFENDILRVRYKLEQNDQ